MPPLVVTSNIILTCFCNMEIIAIPVSVLSRNQRIYFYVTISVMLNQIMINYSKPEYLALHGWILDA